MKLSLPFCFKTSDVFFLIPGSFIVAFQHTSLSFKDRSSYKMLSSLDGPSQLSASRGSQTLKGYCMLAEESLQPRNARGTFQLQLSMNLVQ